MSERSHRVPVPEGHLACRPPDPETGQIEEELIYREEVVTLLFNVSDMARSLERLEVLLGGDDGDEEADES
jgi:hypothetical protein